MGSVSGFRGVELADLELTSARLTLRRWQPGDAARVHEVMADRSMFDHLALPDPYTSEIATAFVTGPGHEGRDDGTGLGSAVVERAGGRVVGSAALRLTGGTGSGDAEIGYWTAPDARGHGYASEVTSTLAEWAFGLGVRRVALLCDVANVASAATALRAGFRFEGVSRQGVVGGGSNGVALRIADLARFARLATDPGEPIAPAFPRLPGDELSDGVLALRIAEPAHAQGLHETEDDEAARWSFTGEARTLEQVQAMAARAGLDRLVGGAAQFAMIDVVTGRVAGHLTLRRSGPPQVGGIGYSVHPAFRGLGYTTRALRLLAAWAFTDADVARLELGAKTGNVASQRAAANAGFDPDGVRRARLRNPDGTFSDEVRFVLLNPRYR